MSDIHFHTFPDIIYWKSFEADILVKLELPLPEFDYLCAYYPCTFKNPLSQ